MQAKIVGCRSTKIEGSKIRNALHNVILALQRMLWCCEKALQCFENAAHIVNVMEIVVNAVSNVANNDCRLWCTFSLPKC